MMALKLLQARVKKTFWCIYTCAYLYCLSIFFSGLCHHSTLCCQTKASVTCFMHMTKGQCRFVYSKKRITSDSEGSCFLFWIMLVFSINGKNHRILIYIISSNLFCYSEIAGIQNLCCLYLLNCPCCMAQCTAQNRVNSCYLGNFLLLIKCSQANQDYA